MHYPNYIVLIKKVLATIYIVKWLANKSPLCMDNVALLTVHRSAKALLSELAGAYCQYVPEQLVGVAPGRVRDQDATRRNVRLLVGLH